VAIDRWIIGSSGYHFEILFLGPCATIFKPTSLISIGIDLPKINKTYALSSVITSCAVLSDITKCIADIHLLKVWPRNPFYFYLEHLTKQGL
jgi:hypothetical protein